MSGSGAGRTGDESISIALVRHGPTAWTAARRLQGRTDVPLSPEGRAAVARWRLPDADRWGPGWCARAWLTSPLARCRETAEALRRGAGYPATAIAIEPRLIERSFGAWEGETLAGLRARHGAAMAAWEARGWDFRPPGGESPREVLQRSLPVLQDMLQRRRSVFCVTHRSVIRAFHAAACGWDMTGRPPQKLRDDCLHLLRLSAAELAVEALNVALESCGGLPEHGASFETNR